MKLRRPQASPNIPIADLAPNRLKIPVMWTNRNSREKCRNLGGDKTVTELKHLSQKLTRDTTSSTDTGERGAVCGVHTRTTAETEMLIYPDSFPFVFFTEHSVSWCLILKYTPLLIPNSPEEVLGEKGDEETTAKFLHIAPETDYRF